MRSPPGYVASSVLDSASMRRLGDIGVTEADLPRLADEAMGQSRLLGNNPSDLGRDEILAAYRNAW